MVYIILGRGFEETEAVTPGDLLRRAGVPTCYAGIGGRKVVGSHGITIEADCTVEEIDLTQMDMIVLPGGLKGVESIKADRLTLEAVRFAYDNGKLVAAICAAPTILAGLHMTDGKNATCYPGMESQMGQAHMVPGAAAVRDGNVITGTSAGCAVAFGRALVEAVAGAEKAEAVIQGIVPRG